MKALVKTERAPGLHLKMVDIPSIGADEVLVKVQATSICGTDYHIYSWDQWSQEHINPPLIAGHEFAGEVVEVGSNVNEFSPGDMVSAETHIVCNQCLQCGMGQKHVCVETSIIGVDVDGCFAEYVAMPAENLWLNSPDLDVAVASAQEPLGNAVQTTLAGPVAACSIAVVGCGPIGLMSIAVARQCGAAQVIATEVNPYRIELAETMGADAVIDASSEPVIERVLDLTDGRGVDGVLEMSGNPTAIDQSMKMVRPGGRVSLLGIPPENRISLEVGPDIVLKAVEVKGIAGRKIWETWHQTRALLDSGLDIEPVLTHQMDLEDFEEGMRLMAEGNCGKVVLIP